jgi:hypothetical protein
MPKTTLTRTVLSLSLLAAVAVQPACSSQKETVTVANVQAAPMPEGGQWEGVYYHQVYGFLHLTESSGAVQGAWRTTAGDKWGELFGEAEGDLLRYSWTEHKVGVVGPNSKSEGKGYFKYSIPKPDEAHEIKGEWGLGESDAGHGWDCLKQLNMEPDPKSVRPNELESQVGASGFDGTKGDSQIGPQEKPKDDAEGDGEAAEGDSDASE